MKASYLFTGSDNGTFLRLQQVYWRNLKKGKEVKKFMKLVADEIEPLFELRQGLVAEFGEDGALGPDTGNYEEGGPKLDELYNQEVELPEAPKLNDGDFNFPKDAENEGFTLVDLGVLEELGLLEE